VVEVRIPPVLRRYAGGHETVEATGGTVRAALDDVFERWPDLRERVLDAEGRLHPYLQLFADEGQVTDLDAPPGRTVDIIAAAEGG
jgi:hypothetical protein